LFFFFVLSISFLSRKAECLDPRALSVCLSHLQVAPQGSTRQRWPPFFAETVADKLRLATFFHLAVASASNLSGQSEGLELVGTYKLASRKIERSVNRELASCSYCQPSSGALCSSISSIQRNTTELDSWNRIEKEQLSE